MRCKQSQALKMTQHGNMSSTPHRLEGNRERCVALIRNFVLL
jgi:hypothetical protein